MTGSIGTGRVSKTSFMRTENVSDPAYSHLGTLIPIYRNVGDAPLSTLTTSPGGP